MYSRTQRNITQRQRITRLDRRVLARLHLVACLQALRRNDVATLAVRILDQSNMRRPVRVVFKTLNLFRSTVLVATEVDNAILLLVTTTLVTRGDATIVVATTVLGLVLGQRRIGSTLMQILANHLDHKATARRGRLALHNRHDSSPSSLLSRQEVDVVARLQCHIRLLPVVTLANSATKILGLALHVQGTNTLDLDLEQRLNSLAHFKLGCIRRNTEHKLVVRVCHHS